MKHTTYDVAPVGATVCDSLAPKWVKSLILLCDSCLRQCCDSLRQSVLSVCFYCATVVRQSATVKAPSKEGGLTPLPQSGLGR